MGRKFILFLQRSCEEFMIEHHPIHTPGDQHHGGKSARFPVRVPVRHPFRMPGVVPRGPFAGWGTAPSDMCGAWSNPYSGCDRFFAKKYRNLSAAVEE